MQGDPEIVLGGGPVKVAQIAKRELKRGAVDLDCVSERQMVSKFVAKRSEFVGLADGIAASKVIGSPTLSQTRRNRKVNCGGLIFNRGPGQSGASPRLGLRELAVSKPHLEHFGGAMIDCDCTGQC